MTHAAMRRMLEDPAIALRVFLPRRSEVATPFEIHCDGATLVCHYHRVETAKYSVVYFHGNGEVVSDYESTLPTIFEAFGCSCLLAEYRGYGMSDGEPTLINLIEDVSYIVPALGVTTDSLIFYGRSFGSLPAIHASSAFPDARALILESGIAEVSKRVQSHWLLDNTFVSDKDFKAAILEFFDHRAKLSAFHGSTYVTHCIFDRQVPLSDSYQLYEWANEPKIRETFHKGDHTSIFQDNISSYARIFRKIVEGE